MQCLSQAWKMSGPVFVCSEYQFCLLLLLFSIEFWNCSDVRDRPKLHKFKYQTLKNRNNSKYIIYYNAVVSYSWFVIGQCCNFQRINSTVEISWNIIRILVDNRLRHLVNNVAMHIYSISYLLNIKLISELDYIHGINKTQIA